MIILGKEKEQKYIIDNISENNSQDSEIIN